MVPAHGRVPHLVPTCSPLGTHVVPTWYPPMGGYHPKFSTQRGTHLEAGTQPKVPAHGRVPKWVPGTHHPFRCCGENPRISQWYPPMGGYPTPLDEHGANALEICMILYSGLLKMYLFTLDICDGLKKLSLHENRSFSKTIGSYELRFYTVDD